MNIEDIKEQFRQVVAFSQEYLESALRLDPLFDDWFKNKQKFITAFQGLTYEIPLLEPIQLDDESKRNRLNRFIDRITEIYGNGDLEDFIIQQGVEGFYHNKVQNKSYSPEGTTIPEGMKLIRAFKFFEDDPRVLEDIQNQASRIIQENKINGTLVLSVHPLDYLSVSENNSNWRSCHALDGDYRAGNLNYMADDVTVVCYLKSEHENERLYGFPYSVLWNDKKWRALAFCGDDVTYLGRQYPFAAGGLADLVLEELTKLGLAPANTGWKAWNYDFRGNIEEYVKNGQYTYHYNDLTSSTYYQNINYVGNPSSENPIYIGKEVKCLCCGANHFAAADTFFCWDDLLAPLGPVYECECCGRSTRNIKDIIFIGDDDEAYCTDCFSEYIFQCPECGQFYRIEFAKYSPDSEGYICEQCYNEKQLPF